jgi:hypothetical protein
MSALSFAYSSRKPRSWDVMAISEVASVTVLLISRQLLDKEIQRAVRQ